MTWLTKQPDTLLTEWLRHTKAPMLSTLPDGTILWCNDAFETLVGWTSVEMVGKLSWKDLTQDSDELAADIELAKETVAGRRTDYQLQKPYATKNGPPQRVVIDVVRYPQVGEFECFLVSVFPVDRGVEFAMGQLTEIRAMLLEMMAQRPTGLTFEKLVDFHKDRPVIAWTITLTLAALLFGNRVIEIVSLAFSLVRGAQ